MRPLDSAVVVGTNDFPHLAGGWHDRERDGRCGVSYRSCKGEGVLRLARPGGAHRLCLLLSGPRGLCDAPLKGIVRVDGREHALELDEDLWVVRILALESDREGPVEAALVLPDAPCPDQVLHNGDGRRLGWYLAAAWVE